MNQDSQFLSLIHFYNTHPINEKQIIQKLQEQGLALEEITAEHLQEYDLDHYGGIEANDVLAQKAGIQSTSYVLDVGSGMGGTGRYLASHYGCRVMGLDITESRVLGATSLTKHVKLAHLVEFRLGNAQDMPFSDATFDTVISQETWGHISAKDNVISECARVIKDRGIIAFTDVLKRGIFSDSEKERLQREMIIPTPESAQGYERLLTKAGFTLLESEDLSSYWTKILAQRLEMYKSLKDQTVERFGEAHYQKWVDTYGFFVELFAAKKMGGARFLAQRDSEVTR